MYNIIQLNDKDLSELQQIAKELGLTKTESLRKEDLVYRILDEQAIVGATKKAASAKSGEEKKEGQPRKRSRISVKKEGDKVYTATKDKAQKLEANTPALPAPAPLFKDELPQIAPAAPAESPAENQAPAAEATEEKPKAKRGRKPGSKNKSTLIKEAQATQAEEETKSIPVPVADDDMELPALDLSNNSDFIPIEDLPSENLNCRQNCSVNLKQPKWKLLQRRPRKIKTINSRTASNARITGSTTRTRRKTTIITSLQRQLLPTTLPPASRPHPSNRKNRQKSLMNLMIY